MPQFTLLEERASMLSALPAPVDVSWHRSPEGELRVEVCGDGAQAMVADLEAALAAILAHCEESESAAWSPADFPLAGVDESVLDEVSDLLDELEEEDA